VADLLDRKLLFVTGKGGVGKTTISAGLALMAASRGKRALVCEVDAKGDLAASFEAPPTRFQESQVAPNLWAMSMDSEASLRQYLSLQLRLPRAAGLGVVARMFDFVASAAPGVREIVTVGKLCWEVRERHYDIVVVDAVASGHIVGQLAAPQAINGLVQVGLVRQQTGWMLDILSDPAQTGALIVSTPEEMPVTETIELVGRLRAETTVDLAGVVVNRVLPELFGTREEQVFEALADPGVADVLDRGLEGGSAALLDAARLMVRTRRARAEHMEHLRRGVAEAAGGPVPMLYVPYLFLRSYGMRSTRQVAAALSAELES
jgi:anion-transporting  ArsA/GET3 family ATPase